MNQPLFTGVGVPIITVFDDDEAVDADATTELALKLIDVGIRAVIIAGSTGEASSLSLKDRHELISTMREAIPSTSNVPIIAGTGAPSAHQATRFTAGAREDGADAVIVLSPPGSENLDRYYAEVEKAAEGIPIFGYHFPGASAPGIPVGKLKDLPFSGLKDSSGDPQRLLETLDTWDGPLYTGSSALLSFAGPLGCAGAILQVANAEPELCIAAFGGDPASQRALIHAHLASKASFPHGIKQQTNARFGTSTVTRIG